MSGKPEDAAKRDVAALAAELAEQIASLAAFSGSGLAPAKAPAARSGPSPGVPSYAGPRTMLENAGRFVAPVLPAGAALRPLKAALLRVLRIVTRDQTTFNSALLEALRGALLETEAGLRDLAAASREGASAPRTSPGRRRRASTGPSRTLPGSRRVSPARARLARARARISSRASAGWTRSKRTATRASRRSRGEQRTEKPRTEVLGGEARRAPRRACALLRLEWSSLRSNLQNLAGAPAARPGAAEALGAVRADDPLRAGLYVDFEEHFRGSEEEIRGRQASDAARFRGAPGPVADLGCGRGEFLEALAGRGLAGDRLRREPGHGRAREGEGARRRPGRSLRRGSPARADGSLGGVTAFQVVEHLPPASPLRPRRARGPEARARRAASSSRRSTPSPSTR